MRALFRKNGFTLLETLVVVVMIGILVAIAIPTYTKSKEGSVDKEGVINLKLINAAEKIYKSENGFYYASGNAQPTAISNLNYYLKLSLTSDASRNWSYSSTGGASSCIQATRNGNNGRTYSITNTQDVPVQGGGC